MKRPIATAPRPAEIQPTVLMRGDSSKSSSSLRCGKGSGSVTGRPLEAVSSAGLERNFILWMIAQVREGLIELVVALWSFSVIDQLDANDGIRLPRGGGM